MIEIGELNFSRSEEAGLQAIPEDALRVLSVGISTGGIAEMSMAEQHPNRHITATTIDEQGLAKAREVISEQGFGSQIDAKIEDVSQPLPYPDNHFDYIYARLVLHYLSKTTLPPTLVELKRVLKPGKNMFVVVRSTACDDAHSEGASYDAETGYTRYMHPVRSGGEVWANRYFHTESSISQYVTAAGFKLDHVTSYQEKLFVDFMRTIISPNEDQLIELLATKET